MKIRTEKHGTHRRKPGTASSRDALSPSYRVIADRRCNYIPSSRGRLVLGDVYTHTSAYRRNKARVIFVFVPRGPSMRCVRTTTTGTKTCRLMKRTVPAHTSRRPSIFGQAAPVVVCSASRSIRNTFRDNIRDRADASSHSTRVPVGLGPVRVWRKLLGRSRTAPRCNIVGEQRLIVPRLEREARRRTSDGRMRSTRIADD